MEDYIGRICDFCEEPILESDEVVFCNSCSKPHHAACWKANGGCTKYGCRGQMLTLAEKEMFDVTKSPFESKTSSLDLGVSKNRGAQFGDFFDSIKEENNNTPKTESDKNEKEKEAIDPEEEKRIRTQKEEEIKRERERQLKLRKELEEEIRKSREERKAAEEKEDEERKQFYKERREREKKAKRIAAVLIPIALILLLAIAAAGVIGGRELYRMSQYSKAKDFVNAGEYREAYDVFVSLKDYKDSESQADEALYSYGKALMDEGRYQEAKEAFLENPTYKDSNELAILCEREYNYKLACSNLEEGKFDEAIKTFIELDSYIDTDEKLKESYYRYGKSCYEKNYYDDAIENFEKAGDYEDSKKYLEECFYLYADEKMIQQDYDSAYEYYGKVPEGYKDREEKMEKAGYLLAKGYLAAKDYDAARELLGELNPENCQDLYEELYKWRAEVIINNSEDDWDSKPSTLTKYDRVYIHIRIHGGPPDGTTTISIRCKMPDTEGIDKAKWKDTVTDGYERTNWIEYVNPSTGSAGGTFKLYVYDGDGNKIGEGSVMITNSRS